MSLSHFIIVNIVGRGDLNCTGSKIHINICITKYRDFPSYNWKCNLHANKLFISLIFWINCNTGISKHCFRACGCNCNKFTLSLGVRQVRIFNGIFKIPQLTIYSSVDYFLIRDSRTRSRIPVHHSISAVYFPFFI